MNQAKIVLMCLLFPTLANIPSYGQDRKVNVKIFAPNRAVSRVAEIRVEDVWMFC